MLYGTVILFLLAMTFFSGMEIAYISANRIHFEMEKKQENFMAKILNRLTYKPSRFVTSMIIGYILSLVFFSFYMGQLLATALPVEGGIGLLTHIGITTLILLFTAEFLSLVFFPVFANRIFKLLAVPAYLCYLLFYVFTEIILAISDFILKYIFKSVGDSFTLSFSKVELGNYISEQMETVETDEEVDSEIQIFQNALDFSEIKSREAMIPRAEIIAAEETTSPSELIEIFNTTGLSKILIYQNSIDNIIGYVHSFEMFKKPTAIKEILMPVIYVPGTMLAKDVLNALTKRRKSIAVIVDEYGGTSGIITVEDIIEELFGEIEDEHDTVELTEQILSDGHYRFSARFEVDYLNQKYDLDIEENEHYETLGGYILHYTEEIPEQGDKVVLNNYTFTILEVSNTKIELVEIKISSED